MAKGTAWQNHDEQAGEAIALALDIMAIHTVRESIRHWLVAKSRETHLEFVVLVNPVTHEFIAGTYGEQEQVSIPPKARADVRDGNQRWEMWHNHPDLDGGRNKGSKWPSAGDLGAAVEHRGLASVGVINETGEWTYIDIRRRKGLNSPGLSAWIDDVEEAAERTLSNAKAKNEPVKLTRSEATMRALERAGYIRIRYGAGDRAHAELVDSILLDDILRTRPSAEHRSQEMNDDGTANAPLQRRGQNHVPAAMATPISWTP